MKYGPECCTRLCSLGDFWWVKLVFIVNLKWCGECYMWWHFSSSWGLYKEFYLLYSLYSVHIMVSNILDSVCSKNFTWLSMITPIGRLNEYPGVSHNALCRNLSYTFSQWLHIRLSISGNSGEILHIGNVVNMPNSYVWNFCNQLIFIWEEFIVVISFNCGKIVQYVDF